MRKIYVGDIKAHSKKNVCNVINWLKRKEFGEAVQKLGEK